jgi:hypothetical protein
MHPAMRQLEKALEKAELVHDLERGWVNRIAAEIAQEVRVLLENYNMDTSSREEESEEHPGGTSSDDATLGGNLLAHLAFPSRNAQIDGGSIPMRRR